MNRASRSCSSLLFSFIPLVATCAQAQSFNISTFAGGASTPFNTAGTGDGGKASSAGLGNPCYDVALDAAGNAYIVAGSVIRKVDTTGNISTVAGGGSSLQDGVPAVQAALSPLAIAVDSSGNIYVADDAYGLAPRIRKIDTGGVINTVAGGAPCCTAGDNGPALNAYIGNPWGLAVDAAGDIYIAQSDSGNNRIRKVSASGNNISTVAGGGTGSGDGVPATSIALTRPTGVSVDGAGNLYITDAGAGVIRRVTADGTITTIAGNGSGVTSGDGGPATKAGLNSPWHVSLDPIGNLFITQTGDALVRLVTAAGNISTVAGNGSHGYSGDGGPATSASFDRPSGIAVSPATGAVLIADATSSVARVRSLAGLPFVQPGGVVPIYSTANTVETGSWVSIYGNGLANQTALWKGDFPTQLATTQVSIDSKPAFLWFASPWQINVQVPDDATLGQVQVTVTTASGSTTSTVTLAPYAPSLSLFAAKYPAAVVATPGSPGNSGAGYDYIGPTGAFPFPTRPARAGETVLLYGVGFGPTNPVVHAGQLFSSAAPSITPPQFSIGGLSATVQFAGIVEAGLFQFNVVVPAAASGDQPLIASVNGIQAPTGIFLTIQ